jgi:hypothetical protein
LEIGLEALLDKFGLDKIVDTIARMSKKAWKQEQKRLRRPVENAADYFRFLDVL